MKQIIFAVEDDAALQELYIYTLESEFDCRCFGDGNQFFDALENNTPDLVLLDINELWTLDRNNLHGKSKNTPFDGMTFKGKVKYTVLNGEIVYKDE